MKTTHEEKKFDLYIQYIYKNVFSPSHFTCSEFWEMNIQEHMQKKVHQMLKIPILGCTLKN